MTNESVKQAQGCTDRELLELAAKAAGLHIDSGPSNGGGINNTGVDSAGNVALDCHQGKFWNPLTDDADAFKLAVKLEMRIATHCNYKMACASDIHMRTPAQVVPWGGDQESAVRQSIVLLAAAIGATP